MSLALNSPGRVKAATLERVLAAVDELDFIPKAEAVTRARRGLGRIGVIAPFTSYPSFGRRLNGVLTAIGGQGFEIVVHDQESAAISRLESLPVTGRLDGLIVMSLPFDEAVAQRLLRQGLTTVLVELNRPGFSSVTIDDAAGGRMVADFLLSRGHTQFGYVGEKQLFHHYISQSEARFNGFQAGLAAAGRELSAPNVRLVPHSLEAARHATHELLGQAERPTAVFGHDDILASGVLKAARERGLSIPDDLAVVGFDDSDLAEPLGLTSVRQPLEESGEIAAQTLLAHLANPTRSLQHITLKLSLVERETA